VLRSIWSTISLAARQIPSAAVAQIAAEKATTN
jgi:hypothetical protein